MQASLLPGSTAFSSSPQGNLMPIKQALFISLPSMPWQPPVRFLSLWVCLFWTISFIHKEINIFCQWVLSLSRMLSGLSHIVACISTSLLTMAERCYTVWLSVCPVALLCSTLCNPMNYSMPGFLFLHHLLVFDQTHFIELVMPSNHLTLCRPPSPPALNLSQHQGLFQWIGSSHQLARVASFIYWSMDTWVVSTF